MALRKILFIFIGISVIGIAFFQGCGAGFQAMPGLSSSTQMYLGGNGSVRLSWAANKESAVNASGGGYRIYYSQTETVDLNSAHVDVPYTSGGLAPTSSRLTGLISGHYQARIAAYSSLRPAGGDLSAALTFTIP